MSSAPLSLSGDMSSMLALTATASTSQPLVFGPTPSVTTVTAGGGASTEDEETTGKVVVVADSKPKKRRKKPNDEEEPDEETTGKVKTPKKEKRSATTTAGGGAKSTTAAATAVGNGMDQTKDELNESHPSQTTTTAGPKRVNTNWKEQCVEYRHQLEKRTLELQNAVSLIDTLKYQLNDTRQQLNQTRDELRQTQQYDREHREFVRKQFEDQTKLLSTLNHDLTTAHAGHVNTLKDQRHHQAATASLLIQQQLSMMEEHRQSLKQKQLIPEQLLLLPPDKVIEEIETKDVSDPSSKLNRTIDEFHKGIFMPNAGSGQKEADLGKAIDHYQKMRIELVELEQKAGKQRQDWMRETNSDLRKQKEATLSDMDKNIKLVNRSVQRLHKQMEPYIKPGSPGAHLWKIAMDKFRQVMMNNANTIANAISTTTTTTSDA